MEVGMLMTRDVLRIHPDTPILEAARLMHVNDIGVLPVAQGNRVVGMITDRDIVTRVLGNGLRASTARAHDAMTRRVFYLFDDEDAEAAARKMRDLQVRRMPIVDRNKRLVGIVSIGDLACRICHDVAGNALEGISETLGG